MCTLGTAGALFKISDGFEASSAAIQGIFASPDPVDFGPTIYFALEVEIEIDQTCDVHVAYDTCQGTPWDSDLRLVDGCGGTELEDAPMGCAANNNADLSTTVPTFVGTKTLILELSTADGTDIGTQIWNFAGRVSSAGNCMGDPHFTRWNQPKRDSFHGECDLVLLHNDEVEGKPLDVHVRTTIRDSYSYVEGVAVKYGEDAIEFEHNALYVNGEKVEDESMVPFGAGNKIVMVDENKRKFQVNIQNMVSISAWSTKHFMGVSMNGAAAVMDGTSGILGDHKTGDMIDRSGKLMDNFQDFAFEWQVNPSDPQIFKVAREPQLPYERCRMPAVSAASRRRKLRGTESELYEQALAACTKNHIPANVQSCVDDVIFTGELELAELV